jgi:hypothetical protein
MSSRERILRQSGILMGVSLLLLLEACSAQATLAPAHQIETAVAATLMALPTWTSPPSATVPVTATELPSPTSPPTGTPTAGPSPTPSPLPLPPGDPRTGLNLSVPDYRDNFSLSTSWGGPNNEAAINMIRDGQLIAVDRLTDGYIWWSTTLIQGSNIYIEVEATFNVCSGKDAAGLGVRIGGANLDNGYTLEIACDGHYRMRKFRGGVVDILQDWTPAAAINQATNALNRIGIVARGSKLYGFVNGEILHEIDDFSFYSGTFALYASAVDTPGLTVAFDEFRVWYFGS